MEGSTAIGAPYRHAGPGIMPRRMPVPVVILCGGRGTRLQEHTHAIPKALVEIGGRPILWHVMQLYASQGFDRFILTTGYLGDQVEAFARASAPGGTTVECVDTGLDTPTGGRLARVADRVDRDRRAARAALRRGRPQRRRPGPRLPREAALRALGQRRLLRLRAGRAGLRRRGLGARADAAGAPGERRAAARLPPRGLLGLHGHLQGRRDAQRPLGIGRAAVADLVMRSVLVTGAYGLLGSWLTKALLDGGARVTVLRRDDAPASALTLEGTEARCTVVRGDVRDLELLDRVLGEEEVDTVFHLAAQTIVGTAQRSPLSTWETNVRGTWVLLEACRRHAIARVVVASSDKAYGSHDDLPYREDHELRARFPYDASKACADIVARSYF